MKKIVERFFVLLSVCTIIFCVVTIVRIAKIVNICNLAAFANVILTGIILIVVNIAFLCSVWVNWN